MLSVKERAQLRFSTWDIGETAAKDRATWNKMIEGPIPHQAGEKRLMMMTIWLTWSKVCPLTLSPKG